jgi:hypothetical protein
MILLHKALPSRVLLLSPQGSLTVTDSDLSVQTTVKAPSDEDELYKVFEYSRAQCCFLRTPHGEDSEGVVLVVFFNNNGSTFVRVFAIADDTGVADLGVAEVTPVSVGERSSSS